eukprot:g12574.t1
MIDTSDAAMAYDNFQQAVGKLSALLPKVPPKGLLLLYGLFKAAEGNAHGFAKTAEEERRAIDRLFAAPEIPGSGPSPTITSSWKNKLLFRASIFGDAVLDCVVFSVCFGVGQLLCPKYAAQVHSERNLVVRRALRTSVAHACAERHECDVPHAAQLLYAAYLQSVERGEDLFAGLADKKVTKKTKTAKSTSKLKDKDGSGGNKGKKKRSVDHERGGADGSASSASTSASELQTGSGDQNSSTPLPFDLVLVRSVFGVTDEAAAHRLAVASQSSFSSGTDEGKETDSWLAVQYLFHNCVGRDSGLENLRRVLEKHPLAILARDEDGMSLYAGASW